MEAAAMGLPVIATNIRGCRQVVDDGLTGVLTAADDASALRDALLLLSRDRELRQRLGEAASRKAADEFDQRKIISTTLEVYERLSSPAIVRAAG
jgi:glycosyltransferase involved in cell wall biosynthesis